MRFLPLQAVVLSVQPRKRLLLGSARILTITGVGFDASSTSKCEFSGGDQLGIQTALTGSFSGARQTGPPPSVACYTKLMSSIQGRYIIYVFCLVMLVTRSDGALTHGRHGYGRQTIWSIQVPVHSAICLERIWGRFGNNKTCNRCLKALTTAMFSDNIIFR